jgi:hypothetical protein
MWEYKEEFDENQYFGFVYKIENLINGMFYFGKKQFSFRKRHKLKSRKNSKIKTIKSDWEEYWGSSKILLDDIKKYGKENFKRTIIQLCKTKSEQTYYENYFIYENHNLLNPLCYNKHIGHVYAKNILNEKVLIDENIKIREIDDKIILEDYNNGLNLDQLCLKYKIGYEILNEIIPKKLRGSNKLRGKRWNKETLDIIKKLFKENVSHQKIGEQVGLDHATVKYILNKKLKIDTSSRDLRTKRPKGLTSKSILLKETNQIFKRGVQEAHEILKISKYAINNSLKNNITYNGYTFIYC